jgi:hypothetical protein
MLAFRCVLSLALAAVLAFSQEVLTNEDILKLVKAGMGEEVILGTINSKAGKFSVTTDDMIALKQAGVSDKIIAAMVARGASPMPAPNGPVVALALPSSEPIVLHDATPVRLRLARNLSSADAKTGESVDFEVLEEVKVDDVVLVARGATAIGTITDAEHKKRMARGGKLNLEIDYVRLVDDEKVALRAVKETSGGGHTGAMTGGMVATAIVFFPAAPFFLFMHGKDTTIAKGTEITAYTNGEIKLDRQKLIAKQPAESK